MGKLELHMNMHQCNCFYANYAQSKIFNTLKSTKIQVLDCPENSPNLNPIKKSVGTS